MDQHDRSPDDLRKTAESLRRSVIQLARRLRVERDPRGISAVKLALLGHLRRRGPQTPGDLAAAEQVQPQSLTRALAALQHAGLVRRSRDARDRRQHRIAITARGIAATTRAMRHRDEWLAQAMSRLPTTEREVLRLAAPLLVALSESDHASPATTSPISPAAPTPRR